MQDVVVENDVIESPVEGNEAQEVETSNNEPEVEHIDDESSEPEVQETVEERLERLTKEREADQRAMDRKTAAYTALNKRLEAERQEMARLQTELEKYQQPKSDAPVEPKLDDFDTYDEYKAAYTEYDNKRIELVRNQERAAIIREQQQQQQMANMQRLQQERADIRKQQEAEYVKENPLYTRASNTVNEHIEYMASQGMVGNGVAEAISDVLFEGNVPAVIDYFGRNGGENLTQLEKIARMSPHKAALEIYKIQQSVMSNPVKEKVNKPNPVNVDRGSAKGGNKNLSSLSGKDLLKHMEKLA